MADGTCDQCGRTRSDICRELCHACYERARRRGDLIVTRKPQPDRCTVHGCNRSGKIVRGMCSLHYVRWKRHGSTADPRLRRSLTRSGYVRVWCPGHPVANGDGYALEHRKVMWDAGHRFTTNDHVHHRNGDKTDNRIDNLEVIAASEHHRHHIETEGRITNQYGSFVLHRLR